MLAANQTPFKSFAYIGIVDFTFHPNILIKVNSRNRLVYEVAEGRLKSIEKLFELILLYRNQNRALHGNIHFVEHVMNLVDNYTPVHAKPIFKIEKSRSIGSCRD